MSATSGFTGANTGRTNGVFFIGDPLLLGSGQKIEAESVVIQGSGAIRANDSISGNEVIIKNCSIFIDGLASAFSSITATLSYAGVNERRSAAAAADLTLDGCILIKRESGGSGARHHVFITNLYDTRIVCENNKTVFLVTEIGGRIRNVLLKRLQGFQPAGVFTYATGLTLDETDLLYANSGRLEIVGLETLNASSVPIQVLGGQHNPAVPGSGVLNQLYLWNKGTSVNNTKYVIQNPAIFTSSGEWKGNFIFEGYTISWKFVDSDNNPVQSVKVCLYDDVDNLYAYPGTLSKRAEYLTNSSGLLVGTWSSRLRSTGASQVRDSLFLLALRTNTNGSTYGPNAVNMQSYSLDPVQNQLAIKSYLHNATSFQQGVDYTISGKIGNVNEDYTASTFENFYLTVDENISEPNRTIVDSYTELDNPLKLYDYAKAKWYDFESYPLLTRSGNTIYTANYNVTFDASAATVYAFDGNTITIKSSLFIGNIEGAGTFTLLNGAEVLGSFGSTTVYPWQVSNVEAGSTLQLFNVTQGTEIENLVIGGVSGTKVTTNGRYINVEPGDIIRLRITCQAGTVALLPFESYAVATPSGLSFRADQLPDEIYNANMIDGSSITNITLSPDYNNIQIDLDDQVAPYEFSAQAIYNYYAYLITTPEGIANFFGAITPIDRLNYRINTSNVPLKIQNAGSSDIVLNGGRLYRDDNVSVIDTGVGAGTGSLMQDTGMLIQYIQPQVESVFTSYGAVSVADLAATENSLKKKITQSALI